MSFPSTNTTTTTTTMWTPKRSGPKTANVKSYLGRRPATIDERPPSRYHDSYSSLDHADDEVDEEVGEQIVCQVREYEYYMNAAKVKSKTILRDDNSGDELIQDDSSLESLEGDERRHSGTRRGIQFHPSTSSSTLQSKQQDVDDERSHKDEQQQEEEQFQRWANSINWNDKGNENDVLPDEDETADELTQLPQPQDISSRSLTKTATKKQPLLDMADLDVDDFDMYLLSIQGDAATVGTSISGNESIFTGSVYSSKSGKLSAAGTASTGVSSISAVSTRSRRSGAAQSRRGKSETAAASPAASPPPPRRKVSGWADSMLLASQINPMSEWEAQSGWTKPVTQYFSTASFRLNEDESFDRIWEEPTPFDDLTCIEQ
jgi:hypothetical protein